MGVFVTGNTPLPPSKVDAYPVPPGQASQYDSASDFNSLWGAAADLRTELIGPSANRGRALALDYVSKIQALGLRADKPCAIMRRDATTLLAYRPMGGPFWEELTLSTGGISNGPYSWNRTRIAQYISYVALATNSSLTYTGASWSALDSGNADLYIGGHAKQATTVADHVDLTFTGGGDLYVIWVGRTSGTFVKVAVDGSDANANALPVGGTGPYHYIDTYTSVDLTSKRTTKVATGLPSGSHTITLTVMADHNAANVSGTTKFIFNGIGLVGKDQGLPIQTNTQTPAWKTATAYVVNDWVQNGGRFYFATNAATSGATPPTHTTGTVSDGAVSWTFAAASSYDLNSHIIQDAGSQLEYAYQIKPSGATVFDDVGGIVHGNETLTALTVDVDGQPIGDPPAGAWISGDVINIQQSINATHSQTGATVVATQILRHRLASDAVTVLHSHTWNVGAAIGWFYAAMWPLFHWGVPTTGSFKYAFDNLFTPQGGKKLATAYYGQSNPIVGNTQDFITIASGGVLQPAGAGGVASTTPPTMTAIAALYVPPPSVNEYKQAGSVFAGMGMNISGVTPPGFSSDVLKMYFERVPTSPTVNVNPNDVWQGQAVYFLKLVPTYPFDPTL